MKNYRGLLTGIAALILILLLPTPEGMPAEGKRALAVAVLMTIWWITEAIPIYATAFVPLALYPLLGILTASATAENYGHNYVLMLLGGFMIAKAIEKQNLHKRIALGIMLAIGTDRRRIILSFMIATALLSMWIANVAVALLMLPIALAIIAKEESEEGHLGNFGLAMMLAIAYSSSVGGTATLLGTPVNMVYAGLVEKLYPAAPQVSFLTWMAMGVPLVVIFLPVIWFYLVRYFRISGQFAGSREIIESEQRALGRWTRGERAVLAIFILTALGWIFRRDFAFGDVVIPGWSTLLGVEKYVHDSTVAIVGALLLFMIPGGEPGKRLLDWKTAGSIPWGVVMIVGGGYAIAESFSSTGLVEYLGQKMSFVGQLPALGILLFVVSVMIFVTEINSNTATANIFLPVLASMAVAGQINPLLLMIPGAFACSFAFMLPSGTGTNTVIFASERVGIAQMARCGLWLNLISIALLTLILYLYIIPVLGLEPGLPDWAG
ncbi:MAG: SLC13/DASS family transporter [Lewinella sp.]|nr:SLC13/DASS family transporter [Lewinella sp.]